MIRRTTKNFVRRLVKADIGTTADGANAPRYLNMVLDVSKALHGGLNLISGLEEKSFGLNLIAAAYHIGTNDAFKMKFRELDMKNSTQNYQNVT